MSLLAARDGGSDDVMRNGCLQYVVTTTRHAILWIQIRGSLGTTQTHTFNFFIKLDLKTNSMMTSIALLAQ